MIFRILDFNRQSELGCPDFDGTAGLRCCTFTCCLVILATCWERSDIAGRDRDLGELWNTWMVGVFVASIMLVYGRMIYMFHLYSQKASMFA